MMCKALWADDVLRLLAPWLTRRYIDHWSKNSRNMSKMLPYELEPEYYSGEEVQWIGGGRFPAFSSTESRQTNSFLCSCGRCAVMKKIVECICCQEITFLSRIFNSWSSEIHRGPRELVKKCLFRRLSPKFVDVLLFTACSPFLWSTLEFLPVDITRCPCLSVTTITRASTKQQ